MAGNGVRIEWGGFDRMMKKASSRFKTQRTALLETVGDVLVSGTVQRFQDEETPDGTKWKPSVRARTHGGKTLQDTGELRDSISYAVAGETVLVGSNKIYARIHQFGGTIKPKKGKFLKFKGEDGEDVFIREVTLPARPYLGLSEEDKEEVADVMRSFLKDCLTRRGS